MNAVRARSSRTHAAHEISRIMPEGAVHQGIAIEVKPLPELSLEEYLAHASRNRCCCSIR